MFHTYILFTYNEFYINVAGDSFVNWNTGNSKTGLRNRHPGVQHISCLLLSHLCNVWHACSLWQEKYLQNVRSEISRPVLLLCFVLIVLLLLLLLLLLLFFHAFVSKSNSRNGTGALIPQFSNTGSLIFPYYWFESHIEFFFIYWKNLQLIN
jgi:hypothetical protein